MSWRGRDATGKPGFYCKRPLFSGVVQKSNKITLCLLSLFYLFEKFVSIWSHKVELGHVFR